MKGSLALLGILLLAGCAPHSTVAPDQTTTIGTPAGITIAIVSPFVRARVFDQIGHGVGQQAVTFTTTTGAVSPGVAMTDASGQAEATLSNANGATVTARAAGLTAFTTLSPNASAVWMITITTSSSALHVGEAVPFLVVFTPRSSASPGLTSASVTYGDGTTSEAISVAGGTAAHVYGQQGRYPVVVTASDSTGGGYMGTTSVTVLP